MIKLTACPKITKREIYKAIESGRTFCIGSDTSNPIHWDDNHGNNPVRCGTKPWSWRGFKYLCEITESHWYDNIPDIGIPCWVWDFSGQDRCPRVVTNRGVKGGFEAGEVYWNHATPILPSECYQEPV